MAWLKIDDHLFSHPKIRRAWRTEPASLGLHLLALSYASAYLTDGAVSDEFVTEQITQPKRREKAVAALIDAGLWERNGRSWTIHDYLDFNDSRVQVIERRKADAARKRVEKAKRAF